MNTLEKRAANLVINSLNKFDFQQITGAVVRACKANGVVSDIERAIMEEVNNELNSQYKKSILEARVIINEMIDNDKH